MITARPQKNLKAAKNYFREHLALGDYYSQGHTIKGEWFGQAAVRLGLDALAPVTEQAYSRLCDNRHPLTGDQLTVRRRTVDRRVCYDFVVSAPKSVSLIASIADDPRVLAAHDAACRTAMLQIETVAATRVRKGGRRAERPTGEVVGAVFRHTTSRALDPQVHSHFVLFNATWDSSEERWKALETSEMFNQITFFTEVYRSDLALRLQELGYSLRDSANAFEIEGVSPLLIDRFSKQRRAILQEEARLTAAIGKPLSNAGRANVAHAVRDRKRRDLTPQQVMDFQQLQLDPSEQAALQALKRQAINRAAATSQGGGKAIGPPLQPAPQEQQPVANQSIERPIRTPLDLPCQLPTASSAHEAEREAARTALDYAKEHLFERNSVVAIHELLRVALAFGRGRLGLPTLRGELAARADFITVGPSLTTRETLRDEQRMVAAVNQGAGRCRPLNPHFHGNSDLSEEQRTALQWVLRSPDEVVILRGRAGTGKTRVLREIVRGIEERHPAVVLAPTAAAVEVLRKEGLAQTATVQRFLADPEFQRAAQGRTIVVDEASFLSVKDGLKLIEAVRTLRARLILSGDSRQHSGVEAGDALRLLEDRAGLQPVTVSRVRRQVNREYRTAIGELAQGQGPQALQRLERLGAVEEIDDASRYITLAAAYVSSLKSGKSALIVSPTWREIDTVTAEVRDRLKNELMLARTDTPVTTHAALNWTRAQKRDWRNYRPGLILDFHRSTAQFAVGDWAEVLAVEPHRIRVRKHGAKEELSVTQKQTNCFGVAEPRALPVSPGDQLLIQGNRKSDGLFNGQLVTARKVQADGGILLTDGRRIRPNFRKFTHGYCVTSHAAQGRTVDHVYVAVDSHTQNAANLNQFYVSTSRGRELVKVFTDDLRFLRAVVTQSGARQSATELLDPAYSALGEGITPYSAVTPKPTLTIGG